MNICMSSLTFVGRRNGIYLLSLQINIEADNIMASLYTIGYRGIILF